MKLRTQTLVGGAIGLGVAALMLWRAAATYLPAFRGDGWYPYMAGLAVAVVVAFVGASRNHSGDTVSRWLVAAGIAIYSFGDLMQLVEEVTGPHWLQHVSEVCWVVCLMAIAWAVWRVLARSLTVSSRWGGALDALTVAAVSAIAFYSVALDSIVEAKSESLVHSAVIAAYPVLDAIILALVIRVLARRSSRSLVNFFFASGVVCWLAADIMYLTVNDNGTWGVLTDWAYVAGASLMAWSTVVSVPPPSDEQLIEDYNRHIVGTLAAAGAPLLLPPLLLWITGTRGYDLEPWETIVIFLVLLTLAFLRIVRLIYELRTLHRDLEKARDEALAASKAKSAFVATISHEIRTPMNGVIGLANLLRTTDLDDRQRLYAERIRAAGDSLVTIINDLLDFAKGEAGKVELEQIDFSPSTLVDEVCGLYVAQARAKGVRLEHELVGEVPALVSGDPTRVRQILLNLVSNALKFTEQGAVRVTVRREGGAVDPIVLRLDVTDTGIGIEPETVSRLFEPFLQADASTTRRFGGTGLGLAICRQLVDAMGGSISVRSERGLGSTFTVRIPFGPASAVPAAVTPDAPSAAKGAGRVLVVDDDEINLMVAEGYLRHLGYEADAVESGEACLAAQSRAQYAAVLMDCHMPGMDGYECTRRWRANEHGVRTPIIALTAAVSDEEQVRTAEAGMDDFLAKPLRADRLAAALQRWVEPEESTSGAAAAPRSA